MEKTVMKKIHEFEEKAWNDFVYGTKTCKFQKLSLRICPHASSGLSD